MKRHHNHDNHHNRHNPSEWYAYVDNGELVPFNQTIKVMGPPGCETYQLYPTSQFQRTICPVFLNHSSITSNNTQSITIKEEQADELSSQVIVKEEKPTNKENQVIDLSSIFLNNEQFDDFINDILKESEVFEQTTPSLSAIDHLSSSKLTLTGPRLTPTDINSPNTPRLSAISHLSSPKFSPTDINCSPNTPSPSNSVHNTGLFHMATKGINEKEKWQVPLTQFETQPDPKRRKL